MPDGFASPPTYPNYFAGLSNLIGNLPSDYRSGQLQQGAVNVQNAFSGGVPTNPDGTPNYAAALQTLAKAGDPSAVATLGPQAQTQAWQTQAQTMSPMLNGAGSGAPSAPAQAPVASPSSSTAAAPSPGFTGSIADGQASPPTLAALVSAVVPDPNKAPMVTGLMAKALGVDPSVPLSPDQMARAQRIMAANKLTPTVSSTDPANAATDMVVKERAAGYDPNGKLTQAQAVAIATGNGGSSGSFALPPAAEAVWNRMVTQESGGQQFKADGSVVTSPKGAIGVAQVMPGTGQEAARLAGLPWDSVRFKNDPNYNLALGKAYYAQQVRAFGSIDVAAAAYNAGPGKVLSAQAKASKSGGDWLSYMPPETQDYVSKVAGQGAPQQSASAQSGNRPIGSQVPLPQGITDPQQAILAIDREMARLSTNPAAKGQVDALADWRDRIATSLKPLEMRAGEQLRDPRTGAILAQTPAMNANSVALQRFMEQNPDATPQEIQAFTRAGQTPRSAAGMALQRFLEENPSADADQIQAFSAQSAGQSLLAKRTTSLALAENEAKSLIPRVREASKAVNRTQYPALNTIIEAGLTGTGDPNIVKFGIAVESLAQTYARVLSPTGSPTAADKANAHEILSRFWGQGQIDAALDQMELEIQSAKSSLDTTRREIGGGERSGDRAVPSSPRATGASPAATSGPLPAGTYNWHPDTGLAPAQ